MIREVVVLSPHRDDAVFSLAGYMRRWAQRGVRVRVLNFYTLTEYGPWVPPIAGIASRASTITRRAYEDRHAVRQVHSGIALESCGLLDAPIRLNRPVPEVMQLSSRDVRREDVAGVIAALRGIGPSSLVVAPLGVGGHIDHLTVRQGAIESIVAARLLFYEDLPYASWTSREVLQTLVDGVSRIPLRRNAANLRTPLLLKQSWVSRYTTQIRREEAQFIARYTSEGLWGPNAALGHLP